MKIIGWICLVSFVLLMVVNTLFMVTSPAAWFRLPPWLRASGNLKPEEYAQGFGGIQIRFVGGVILLVMVWVVYDCFFSK
jgi:hypothetical protein